jgi:hypothetical protein
VYTESDTDTKKGQKYSTVNLGIHVGLQSSPLGVEGLRALFLSAGIPVPSCSAMQNAGIYVSKTTVQVNEMDMQERRQKLLNLNKIRGFDESHPISVSGDARYNNRLESGVGKTPFQPATQSVYCISENETPNKDIICVNIDNMLCDTAQLMRAKGRNVKCPNHRGICTANLDRTDVIGNESRSAERCAHKIAQDETPLVVGQFTSDGDSAASIGFERGQQTHCTVYVENLRDTRHLSESHRKLVKNVDFSKQMFPGINKKEQDRVRARFSMDVTKRCSAEIKQAHKQFAGHMTKIIRKLSYTSDSIVACVTGQCGQLCKKHSLVCSGGRKAVWKAKFLPPGTKLHPNNEDLRKLRECIHLRLGPKALMKTRLNTNTQKNESVNRTLTKTNPKFGTWRRTLPGRIHGGVHMRNCGVSSSIQSRCKAVGAEIHSSLVKRQLKNIQDRNDYHMTRKNSIKYKERQAVLRCARFSDQEIIMEKDKTYVKNILDPEFSEDDHSRLYSKKPKSFRMTMRKT